LVATDPTSGEHASWRMQMVTELAARLDAERFGVVAIYVIGSTKNGTAGPASDIDLIVHIRNDLERQAALERWLDGWSQALAATNLLRTGLQAERLLDLHFVTDADIAEQGSFAVMIGTPRAEQLAPARRAG